MPIRINLLADAQAAEEARRRDPVKRAAWIAGFLVFLMALWIVSLQLKVGSARSGLRAQEQGWTSIEKKYGAVLTNQARLGEINGKLSALYRLSTNRFLWGPALNAFQQTLVDQVQVVRFKTEQTYVAIAEVPSKKQNERTIPGSPAASVEKLSITLDARDNGNAADQNFNKYKLALESAPFFKTLLQKQPDGFRLVNRGAQTSDLMEPTKLYAPFTLECVLPEKRIE